MGALWINGVQFVVGSRVFRQSDGEAVKGRATRTLADASQAAGPEGFVRAISIDGGWDLSPSQEDGIVVWVE